MVKTSIVGEEELDEAKSAILADRGSIAEYQARMTEAQLPAREEHGLSGKAGGSPASCPRGRGLEVVAPPGERAGGGRVEDVFFRAGETANAAQAVVSLLTPTS